MNHGDGDGLSHARRWQISFGMVAAVVVAGAFAGLLIWDRLHPVPCYERYPDPRSQYLACEIERLKAQIKELEAELEELIPPEPPD